MRTRTLALLALLLAGCATPARAQEASTLALSEGTVAASPPRADARRYAPLPADELKKRLSPLAFEVTQHAATEPPFQNPYFNNHAAGIYVDVATGEPLFSSRDKFESGTGWPSFTRPIEQGRVVAHDDTSLGMVRTEVVSAGGGSHLGHVFPDGPQPTGLRYCINSAALRFIPADRLAAEGYGAYAAMFGASAGGDAPGPATSNSCTLPPPGAKRGCSATLEVAIFGQNADDEAVTLPEGVLEVAPGKEGSSAAVEVTFDPQKVGYAALVATWTKGREPRSTVYARTDAQKREASGRGLRVADAVPFERR